MANRRMFSKSVTSSASFISLPLDVQGLYFQLGMNADDDGYCDCLSILRMTLADIEMVYNLATNGLILIYENYIIKIVHWDINNQIRKDRYTKSMYKEEELQPLEYNWQPDGNQTATVGCHSIGKDRVVKKKKEKDKKEKKVNIIIPYKEIISFLNETLGKSNGSGFKITTKETQRLIKARFNEGYTLEDFKTVITKQNKKWGTDPKMVDYLRPSTLFGSKFESYLNAPDHKNFNNNKKNSSHLSKFIKPEEGKYENYR